MTNNNVAMAAVAYADAATNNQGYGIAARYAAYALADLIDAGTDVKQADAARIIADAATAALSARNGGKEVKCGAAKVIALGLAFDATVEAGFSADAADVIGAVYRARVGKVEGGAKRIAATLQALKGTDPSEAVATLEALSRTAPKPPTGPTLEAVQAALDKWAEAEWSDKDRATLAGMLATAAEGMLSIAQ